MSSKSDNPKFSKFNLVMKYFGIIMALVYVIVGVLVIMHSSTLFNIPSPYSLPIGLMLVAYGAFRGYRVYTKYFN